MTPPVPDDDRDRRQRSAPTNAAGLPRVELIYDPDCRHVELARESIRAALRRVGLPERWREWNGASAATPARYRGVGSPAVLVDGEDVDARGTIPLAGGVPACRLYQADDGSYRGAPSARRIAVAVQRALASPGGSERQDPT